jgi:hypothetical protein
MMEKTYTNLFTNALPESILKTDNTKVSNIDRGYRVDTLVTNTSSPDDNIVLSLPSASYHFHCNINIVKVTTKPDFYIWTDSFNVLGDFAGGEFDIDITGAIYRVSMKSGNTAGDAVEFTDIMICSQADWQDLKALYVTYIDGNRYELNRAHNATIPGR